MEKKKPIIYESYPAWIVILVLLFQIVFYLAGAFIMFTLSLITGILYLIFVVVMELYIYRESCPNCCYYGKCCAFGRGKVAGWFFKKGDVKKFGAKEITFKDFIPQLIVSFIPVVVGIALLISRGFNWLILIATIYPVFSWFVLNPIVYGKLTCPHCKQGSICCPALDFFGGKNKKKK